MTDPGEIEGLFILPKRSIPGFDGSSMIAWHWQRFLRASIVRKVRTGTNTFKIGSRFQPPQLMPLFRISHIFANVLNETLRNPGIRLQIGHFLSRRSRLPQVFFNYGQTCCEFTQPIIQRESIAQQYTIGTFNGSKKGFLLNGPISVHVKGLQGGMNHYPPMVCLFLGNVGLILPGGFENSIKATQGVHHTFPRRTHKSGCLQAAAAGTIHRVERYGNDLPRLRVFRQHEITLIPGKFLLEDPVDIRFCAVIHAGFHSKDVSADRQPVDLFGNIQAHPEPPRRVVRVPSEPGGYGFPGSIIEIRLFRTGAFAQMPAPSSNGRIQQ